jgi:hypothetical protein
MMELYLHSPMRLHGIVLNQLSTGTILPYTQGPHKMYIHYSAVTFFYFPAIR